MKDIHLDKRQRLSCHVATRPVRSPQHSVPFPCDFSERKPGSMSRLLHLSALITLVVLALAHPGSAQITNCPIDPSIDFYGGRVPQPSALSVDMENLGTTDIEMEVIVAVFKTLGSNTSMRYAHIPVQNIGRGATVTFAFNGATTGEQIAGWDFYQTNLDATAERQTIAITKITVTPYGGSPLDVPFPVTAQTAMVPCLDSSSMMQIPYAGPSIFLTYGQFVNVNGVTVYALTTRAQSAGTFNFDLTADPDPLQARLLTHVYRNDTDASGQPLPSSSFFSAYQLDSDHTTPQNSHNPQMRLDGKVTNPPSTNHIWFKLLDPQDPSPYAAADSSSGDNRDGASLLFFDGQQMQHVDLTAGRLSSDALQASWDDDHRVHLILQGSDHVSGDNYKVIASFDAPDSTTHLFRCETTNTCSTSPVVTMWKRIYIEHDAMFKKGSFIVANTDLNTPEVQVRDGSLFHAGQSIRLIHGSPFLHGVGPGGSLGDTSFFEDATILTPAANDPLSAVYQDQSHTWHVRLTHSLRNLFRKSPINGVDIFADAVGVVTGNPVNDLYLANTSLLSDYFASMFVDVATAPETVSEFPYIDIGTATPSQTYVINTAHLRWFQNATRGTTSTNVWALPDHMHLISATRIAFTPLCQTNYGDTRVDSGNNVSWIYERRIEDAAQPVTEAPCNGAMLPTAARIPQMVSGATVAHELTHQWRVNHQTASSGGHCSAQSYLGNGDICLMSADFPGGASANQIDLGLLTLHYLNHGLDSEYITIRTTSEPVPQQ